MVLSLTDTLTVKNQMKSKGRERPFIFGMESVMNKVTIFILLSIAMVWLCDLVYLFMSYLILTIKELHDHIKKYGLVGRKVIKPQ